MEANVQRPSWDQYFLTIAEAASLRGDCRRSQVGAVVVDRMNRVLGVGYNGVAPGEVGCLSGACPRGLLSYDELPPGGSYSNCKSIHAEVNAVVWAAKNLGSDKLIGSTVYVTRQPCDDCAMLIRNYGIRKVIYPGVTESEW